MSGICRTGPAGAEPAAVPPRKRSFGASGLQKNRPMQPGGAVSAAKTRKTPQIRGSLAEAGIQSGIMFRAARGIPCQGTAGRLNRPASRWWITEQTFDTLKRRFLAARSRFMGRRGVETGMTLKAKYRTK